MLSLDFIRQNRDSVARACAQKNVSVDLDALLALDGETRGIKTEIDRLRAERNAISAGFKSAAPEEKAELGRRAKEAGTKATELETELAIKDTELKELLLRLPNIPWDGAPVGPDENSNVVVRTEAPRATLASPRATMSS